MDAHKVGRQLAVDECGSGRIVARADAQEGEFRGRRLHGYALLREAAGALAGWPGLDALRWKYHGGYETPVFPRALASSLQLLDDRCERSFVVRLHPRRSTSRRGANIVPYSFASALVAESLDIDCDLHLVADYQAAAIQDRVPTHPEIV